MRETEPPPSVVLKLVNCYFLLVAEFIEGHSGFLICYIP